MDNKILKNINCPQDVKALDSNELEPLCGEIRDVRISNTADDYCIGELV